MMIYLHCLSICENDFEKEKSGVINGMPRVVLTSVFYMTKMAVQNKIIPKCSSFLKTCDLKLQDGCNWYRELSEEGYKNDSLFQISRKICITYPDTSQLTAHHYILL
ncbi:MAG: hypothetical protein LBH45_01325 [Campylobacteraceae bacterium]|jgi:hypothetical protein|nr:hypothetical protein [Campylobacteraceae bacterium]